MTKTKKGWDSATRVVIDVWAHTPRRRRWQFFVVLLLTLVGALAEVMTLGAMLPFLAFIARPEAAEQRHVVRSVMEVLGVTHLSDYLVVLTLLFSAAAILAGVMRIFIGWASFYFVYTFGRELATNVYERMLYQPYRQHIRSNSSTAIVALQQVQVVAATVLMPVLQMFSAAIIILFILIALIAINPIVTIVGFVGLGAAYLAISMLVRSRLSASTRMVGRAQLETVRSIQEAVGAFRDIILNDAQGVFLAHFAKINAPLWKAQTSITLASIIPRFILEAGGMALVASLACFLVLHANNVADVLPLLGVFALGAQRLLPLLQQLYANWTLMRGNLASAQAVLNVLQAPGAEDRQYAPTAPLPFEEAIVFKDVSFQYEPDQRPVLRNFNLTIAKGARIALVGTTGAGKSTVVDLLMGLLEPTSGSIEIDAKKLDATTRRSWQRRIAHVPQSIFLTDATIAANIALGVEPGKVDHRRICQAAQQAALGDFIANLPQGYDTPVGERGISLSGGQRQRIGIARALYKEASVFVFDEATNALDSMTEATILDVIRQFHAEATVIIIAHRPVAEFCDQVITLNNDRS